MKAQEIITQATRSYSASGYAGLRELFNGLSVREQAEAMTFTRAYATHPEDENNKRFADAFMQFNVEPVPGHKHLA